MTLSLSTRRAAIIVLMISAVVLGAPTSARAGAACPDLETGVTVVVDFRAAGGAIEVGCAPGAPSSGFAALQAAGFTTTEVQGLPGFLCKIDGLPAEEDCAATPPADAYWSYWSAERGGSWSYSIAGGVARTPTPGTVDGWSFGAATAPGMNPPDAPSATTTTTTTTTTEAPPVSTTTTTEAVATTTSEAAAPATTTTAAPKTTPTTGALEATTTSRAATTETTRTTAATTTTTLAAAGTTTDVGNGGSGLGAVVALGAIVAVGVAGTAVAMRRRKAA